MNNTELTPEVFLRGIRSAIGLGIGYVPIGITYGVLAQTGSLTFIETLAMSLMVFAGASQFIALNLLAAGVGPFQIVFTVFMVNLRHFLMSTSLREKIDCDSRLIEAVISFGITDETFAVSSIRDGKVGAAYMFGLNSVAYLSWTTSSAAGYLIGGELPFIMKSSMSIALYALFIGLLVPSIRKSKEVLAVALGAGGLNSGLRLFLNPGWSLVIASLAAALAGTVIFGGRNPDNPGGGD